MFRVLTAWPWVETQLALTMVAILQADSRIEIHNFVNTPNTTRLKELLLDRAKKKLSDDMQQMLEVLVQMFSEDFKKRNKLAHWLSGVSPQVHDGLLLENPHAMWKYTVEIEEWKAAMAAARERDDFAAIERMEMPGMVRQHAFVYKIKDFDDMLARFKQTQDAFFWFRFSMIQKGEGRADALSRLNNVPRVLSGLETLRARLRTAPAPRRAPSLASLRRLWKRACRALGNLF